MYQLISAVGKALNFDGQYQTIDIGNIPMQQLYQTYVSVYVTLSNTATTTEYVLDLYRLPTQWKISTITFNAFLIQNENRTLPVETEPLDLTYRLVRFYDLWQYDFNAKGHDRDYHPDYFLDVEERRDVLVSKSTANYANMVKYGLFTVNGFIHRSEFINQGVFILDGGTSHKLANNNLLGLIDFQHVGQKKEIPITLDMLVEKIPGLPLKDAVYIQSPESFLGKVPMLVIGGYLHPLGNLVQLVNDNTLKFNFKYYNWLDRYLESKSYIDLSSLEITPLTNGAIDQIQFYSDDVIRKYLTLSQSFIVLVDTPYLDVGVSPVSYSLLAGRYLTGNKPQAPLLIGHGRIAEYKVTTENGQYVLAVDNYLLDTRVNSTYASQLDVATTENAIPSHPIKHASAKFLMLSRTDS
jgi:hypothetical protein